MKPKDTLDALQPKAPRTSPSKSLPYLPVAANVQMEIKATIAAIDRLFDDPDGSAARAFDLYDRNPYLIDEH